MNPPADGVVREAVVSELERRLYEMRAALEQTRRKMIELEAEIRRLKQSDGAE